jgi:hypothetical protein
MRRPAQHGLPVRNARKRQALSCSPAMFEHEIFLDWPEKVGWKTRFVCSLTQHMFNFAVAKKNRRAGSGSGNQPPARHSLSEAFCFRSVGGALLLRPLVVPSSCGTRVSHRFFDRLVLLASGSLKDQSVSSVPALPSVSHSLRPF